jgi:SAM-dependent methyltransferase
MHTTALASLVLFAKLYGGKGKTVVDVGGSNVNGTARPQYEAEEMKYICIDVAPHPSVDIVVKPGDRYPFEDGSIDLVISSSCFEHDPCFWMTFKEMCRIVKKDGYILVNAPSNGFYHRHPGDNWRFYGDAGQSLAYWSGVKAYQDELTFPVKVIETFFIEPYNNVEIWRDFVCIWQRTDEPEKEFVLPEHYKKNTGRLQQALVRSGLNCTHMQ